MQMTTANTGLYFLLSREKSLSHLEKLNIETEVSNDSYCRCLCLMTTVQVMIGEKVPNVTRRWTRKLSYRKDDRAMRPMYGCPGNFREWLRPRLLFPKF